MIPFNRLGIFFKLFSHLVYPRRILIDLSSLLKDLPPESHVLDVGSGTGVLVEFAYSIRDDLKYISTDPAFGMIKYAPEYALKAVAASEYLPFKDLFNLVLMGDAIHHIDDPHMAIVGIKRCMNQKGALFIFDLNPDTFIGGIICRIERFLKEPANFYSPQVLSDILKAYGFKTAVNRYDFRYSVIGKVQDN